MKKVLLIVVFAAGVLAVAGCKPKAKDITPLQRKTGASLASEASFAVTMRDYARAEGLLAKAVVQCPDDGSFWVALGKMRVLLNNKSGAKEAYERALAEFKAAADEEKKDPEHYFRQIDALMLLGRVDKARAVLQEAQKKFPDHPDVKRFARGKVIDQILADPELKRFSL